MRRPRPKKKDSTPEERKAERIRIRTEQANHLAGRGFKVEFLSEVEVRVNDRLNLRLDHGRWRDAETGDFGDFFRVRDVVFQFFPRQQPIGVTQC